MGGGANETDNIMYCLWLVTPKTLRKEPNSGGIPHLKWNITYLKNYILWHTGNSQSSGVMEGRKVTDNPKPRLK
jgi:hypothetical protein